MSNFLQMPKMAGRKPDSATKSYVGRADVFGDLFNLAILGMDAKVVQGSLMPMPGRTDGGREMDTVKSGAILKGGKTCDAILFAECQTNVDYSMPLRMMAYEADILMKELSEKKEENRKKGALAKGSEYVSGIKRDERITLVMGIVVYWGEKPWDGKTRLKGMFQTEPEKGSEHELRLIEIMRLKEEEMEGFTSDLREVALFMQNRDDVDKIDKLMEENMGYRRMSTAGAAVLKSLASIDINVDEGKEEIDVCKAWTDQRRRGYVEGENEKALEVILNLHKRKMPASDIASVVARPEAEVSAIINNRSRYAFSHV